MTNNEVNKVIAKYMGLTSLNERNIKGFVGRADYKVYTEALDSLVPVWERLDRYAACGKQESQGFQATMLPTTVSNMASVYSMPSIQEAAAQATAKAIMALEEQ